MRTVFIYITIIYLLVPAFCYLFPGFEFWGKWQLIK